MNFSLLISSEQTKDKPQPLLFFIILSMTTPTLTHPTSVHTAIIPQDSPSITLRPVQSIDTIVEAYEEYTRLKARLLNKNDYHEISGKAFIKKS